MAHFTALPIPPHITQAVRTLTPRIAGATFTHEDEFHLTLKYLGEPAPETLQTLAARLATTTTPPLPVTLTHLHVFATPTHHVLVALTENTPQLHNLHRHHESLATSLGLPSHHFPSFMPHITLASYPPQAVQFSTTPLNLTFTATTLTLYRSNRPHGTGVGRYTPLQSFPLAG